MRTELAPFIAELDRVVADMDRGVPFYEPAQRFEGIRSRLARLIDDVPQADLLAAPDVAACARAYEKALASLEASLRAAGRTVGDRLAGRVA